MIHANKTWQYGIKLPVRNELLHFTQATLPYNSKFGNLGANGVKGSKFLVENVIFGIADPDTLLLSAPIVKLFQAKKNYVQFWPKFDSFWGQITSLRDFTSNELLRVKIHPRSMYVSLRKKGINK